MADDFDDTEEARASSPLDYVSPDQVQDLWGIGYTIVPRSKHPDPFYIPGDMIPKGRSYQWMHLVHDKFHFERPDGATPSGWAPVPASRYPGYFMPFGTSGQIEVSGCGLFEKSTFEVESERAAQVAAAHKQVDDWKAKYGGEFSGEISVGGQKSTVGSHPEIVQNAETKTIDLHTKLPKDVAHCLPEIFAERDALYSDLVEKWNNDQELNEQQEDVVRKYHAALDDDPETLKGPTLNAMLMPIAIENVRKRLSEEKENAQTS